MEAVGPLGKRPVGEQQRLHAVISRVSAALRVQLLRLDLPTEDRRLFDAFELHYPDLVEQLFEDEPQRRMSALRKIPLEPNTGAGVLLAAKVDDADFEVVELAFEIAYKLHDTVVTRNLLRQVRHWNAALRDGVFEADEGTYRIVLVHLVDKVARICTRAPCPQATPTLLEALRLFADPAKKNRLVRYEGVIEALGWLGDEAAAPDLVKLLPDGRVAMQISIGQGQAVIQTTGDAALIALLRIFKLPHEPFGLMTGERGVSHAGFESAAQREAGHRAFLAWYEANAKRPAAERAAPTSQPAAAAP